MMDGLSFIWDLDGTLLDSYDVMTRCLRDALAELGAAEDYGSIRRRILQSTVSTYLTEAAERNKVSREALFRAYVRLSAERVDDIPAMEHAAETLSALRDLGAVSFVFTHRGSSARQVLERLGLSGFFTEIIDGNDGFPRKPDPTALLYLCGKYSLDRARCYYVGDRTLDGDCAANAGIRDILFLPPDTPVQPSGTEDYVVRDLLEIPAYFKREN